MIQYVVKGTGRIKTYLEIVRETDSGYDVRITSEYEDCSKTMDEYMSKELFDSCLRTGYLTRVDVATALLSAAS